MNKKEKFDKSCDTTFNSQAIKDSIRNKRNKI